ncbi:MAG TPA: flagellin FliC, partial [Thiomicrospira sp.]|nr:flagellin FliC [Thiomicrospira sp.]
MSMVINTNIAAENAVRLLDRSSREMATSMERLTSGLRINRTADDAAGKAVVEAMSSQIRGTDMAIRNTNDGISLGQTVGGAAEETVNIV